MDRASGSTGLVPGVQALLEQAERAFAAGQPVIAALGRPVHAQRDPVRPHDQHEIAYVGDRGSALAVTFQWYVVGQWA